MKQQVFNTPEVAKILGVTTCTVYEMRRNGEIKPARGIRGTKYTRAEIERVMGSPIVENDDMDKLKQENLNLRRQLAYAMEIIDGFVDAANMAAREARRGSSA